MTIEPIAALAAEAVAQTGRPDASAAAPLNFSDWVKEQVRTANSEMITADEGVRRLAIGDPVNLHQVIVNLERAKLRFDLVLQVRNKLLEAYQDVMRMQI